MRFLGNFLWFFVAGLWLWLGWTVVGLFWCVTVVGIPWGLQCYKFAKLMLAPFGKEIVPGSGAFSILLNILWIVLSGVPLAIEAATIGVVLCVTVIGIPFGLQCFKLAGLALAPFGARVVRR